MRVNGAHLMGRVEGGGKREKPEYSHDGHEFCEDWKVLQRSGPFRCGYPE
jgi:hypothetical protein